MSATWYLTAHSWRRRTREIVVLALLVALSSGVVMASLAAAHRTDTAYDRFVVDTDGYDLLANPDNGSESALDSDAVAALPQVAASGRVDGYLGAQSSAASLADLESFSLWGGDESVFYEMARPNVLAGRMPDPTRPDEAFVNPWAAQQFGLAPGDTFEVSVFGYDDLETVFGAQSDDDVRAFMSDPDLGRTVDLHITGIALGPDDIASEPAFQTPIVYTTPAFGETYEPFTLFWGVAVQLVDEPGAAASFKREVDAMVPDEVVVYQSDAATRVRVEHAVRPYVVALWVFAGLAAVIGLVLVAQAIGRALESGRADLVASHALGCTRPERARSAFLWTLLPLVIGLLLGVALAWVLSPLAPIGPVKDAEVAPGLRFETAVIPVAAGAILLALLLVTAFRSWRVARVSADEAQVVHSRVAAALGRSGAPVPVTMGVRFGFERRPGTSVWSTRGVLLGGATAILLGVGILTFGASLDHFTRSPGLFGQQWDLEVNGDAEPEQVPALVDEVAAILVASPEVHSWAWLRPNEVMLDGVAVPALGFDPTGGLEPTMRSGRAPSGPDEIALGSSTADTLDVGIGDDVTATTPDGDDVTMTMVGTAVLPATGTYGGSDKTALGQGALMAPAAMDLIGPPIDKRYAVVRLEPDADVGRLEAALGDTQAGTTTVDPAHEPADVENLARLRGTPLILLALLGLSVVAGVLHALVTAFRGRRHDLAVLRACGYRTRQVRITSVWQAVTIAVVALIIGLPLGVVAGRVAWMLLTQDLGVLTEPRVPALALAALSMGTLVLAGIAGLLAGSRAARASAANILRSE